MRPFGRLPRTANISGLKPTRSLNNFGLMLAQLHFYCPAMQRSERAYPRGSHCCILTTESGTPFLILNPAFSLELPLICWFQIRKVGGGQRELRHSFQESGFNFDFFYCYGHR